MFLNCQMEIRKMIDNIIFKIRLYLAILKTTSGRVIGKNDKLECIISVMNELSRRARNRVVQGLAWTTVIIGSGVTFYTRDPINRGRITPYISEHIGNYALTTLPMIVGSMLGPLLEFRGRADNNRRVETLGRVFPYVTMALLVLANIAAESQFLVSPELLNENMGDLAFGLFALLSCAPVADNLQNRFRRVLNINSSF